MTITDQEYVEYEGNLCPVCKSDNIESDGSMEVMGGGASQQVVCRECGRHWHDLYTLTGYTVVEA